MSNAPMDRVSAQFSKAVSGELKEAVAAEAQKIDGGSS